DFSFLKEANVILYDRYEMEVNPQIDPQDILIGYSKGGRVAVANASPNDYHRTTLRFITAHPGVATEEDRANRTPYEHRVIHEMEEKTKEEFLTEWNSLPIFEHDVPVEVEDDERFKKSVELFDRYRLSKQKDHLPELIKNKDKVLYIVGLQDDKYMDLAESLLLPHDISVKGILGGHRLFQKSLELKQVLQDEGIL